VGSIQILRWAGLIFSSSALRGEGGQRSVLYFSFHTCPPVHVQEGRERSVHAEGRSFSFSVTVFACFLLDDFGFPPISF
jgi:hypothetical protein